MEYMLLPSGELLEDAVYRSVRRSDLYSFSLQIWQRWKRHGLPHGGGWMNERSITLTLIDLWEDVYTALQVWKMEQQKRNQ